MLDKMFVGLEGVVLLLVVAFQSLGVNILTATIVEDIVLLSSRVVYCTVIILEKAQ